MSSEELVATVAESASALTLQESNVPHHTVDGRPLSSFPFSKEELVAGAAESASAQTMQEPDVSSLELVDTASLEGSITDCPQTAPDNTIDGSVSAFPFGRDKIVAVTTEYAAALTLQKADTSSSEELLDSTSSEEASSPHCTTDGSLSFIPFRIERIAESEQLSTTALHDTADGSPPSVGPPILFRYPPHWYQTFYMRVDCEGNFHMYPDLGGPFPSLQEAEAAISHHLNKLRLPEICEKPSEGPLLEWRIKQCLYYPDGTRKRGPESPACKNPHDRQRQLVKALLDQYNEYHNLCKDLARELKDLVHFQWIYEDHMTYYHFNFTTKTKADDDNLFFAEVSRTGTEDAWVVSCCCMIEPNDNGHCHGCCNNGSRELMHPNNTRAYIGGHVDGYLPFGGDVYSDDEEDEEAYEARLRFIFKER
ncbi:unnamed protein product [Urochloa decumbens]|uniref:DUF3615 domain-containing protein n=1 Tax=Urochloa decumbens TaxID=240449 RepID=A0ABC9DVU1_9POAL